MVMGVAVGGEVMVARVNCAGVLLVGGWDSVLILDIPRTATNNSSTVTSTGIGKVM